MRFNWWASVAQEKVVELMIVSHEDYQRLVKEDYSSIHAGVAREHSKSTFRGAKTMFDLVETALEGEAYVMLQWMHGSVVRLRLNAPLTVS